MDGSAPRKELLWETGPARILLPGPVLAIQTDQPGMQAATYKADFFAFVGSPEGVLTALMYGLPPPSMYQPEGGDQILEGTLDASKVSLWKETLHGIPALLLEVEIGGGKSPQSISFTPKKPPVIEEVNIVSLPSMKGAVWLE